MANELVINYPTGATLYALLFDATGQVWNGSAFAAPGSASWTDYDIAMSEVATSTGIYRASMPAAAAGVYSFVVRKQAGASPAVADVAVGSGKIEWNGTAEIALSTLATSAALAVVDTNVDTLLVTVAACASIAANSTDATASGAITRKRGNTWSIALTLGEVTGYTSLWFTVKRSYDDADSAALLHVKLNATGLSDGLLYVNGAAATNDALASITVSDATTGAIVIAVDETITDDIAPGSYYYDAQALISGAVTTPDSGTFTVTSDVTRSVA